jgi:hypothetical protein
MPGDGRLELARIVSEQFRLGAPTGSFSPQFLRAYAQHAPIPDPGAHWLVDWLSSYTRFAYFNVRRCLGNYSDQAGDLDVPSAVVEQALDDLPHRVERSDTLTRKLTEATANQS